MKLTFLGATLTVTGSKYLLEVAKKKYLIDCGLFQGQKELRLRNREPFPIDPRTITAVILTHAHLDHSGYIPLLIKQGFKGKIFASHSTCDLCEILLLDAGRIQEDDARRANRYGYSKHHPALPLYTENDAKDALKYFHGVDFDKIYHLEDNLTFSLSHSGHILGSSFITLKQNDTTLVFSGDLGRPRDPVMTPPVQIQFADYLVLESTYGARLHPNFDVLDELEEVFNSTFAKGGSVIIPAFAVGRTQILLYYIYKLKQEKRLSEHIPIYLDSPMAQDATTLWNKYAREHRLSKDECSKVCAVAEYVQSQADSKSLNSSPVPSIIISASGMAEGGRILHHLAHYAPKEENTILFVGFQAAGTRGDRMLKGEKEIKIHGHLIPVRARIENLDTLSSHADYKEILDWLKGFKSAPKQVFITHGEPDAAESLKSKIEEALGWKVSIPHYLDTESL
ncbi:MAG: MBL fold metallo-hydrolase [Parachlamydia sp.]|nr:MAG: MBL fold metallo-hydrolase [Parachlamydia sp.]